MIPCTNIQVPNAVLGKPSIRVFGTKCGLEWEQEGPDKLWFSPLGQCKQLITRNGPGVGEDGEMDDMDAMQDQMDEPIDVNVEVEGFNENVDLVPAPKPVTTSPASKSPYNANSGQVGMDAKPVNFDDGNKGKEGRPTPKYSDQNNTTKPDVKPATKPDLAQAAGVNTKSVID